MILVTGSTGNVGRHVVGELVAKGVPVRAVTRNPGTASLPQSAEVVAGELAASADFDGWFDGVEAAFFMLPPPLFMTGSDIAIRTAKRFVEAAAGKVERIVFLSSAAIRDGHANDDDVIASVHAEVERIIEASKIQASMLRPGGFASNAIRWWGSQIRAGNVIRWPFGEALTALIDERDIASVGARILLETTDQHAGKRYVLTGPEAITQAAQVGIIGEAIGRPLRFEEISREMAFAQFTKAMPAQIATFLLDNLADAQTNAPLLTDTVEALTGTRARSFLQWAMTNIAAFIADAA